MPDVKTIIALTRYILPPLALIILGFCLASLLKRKPRELGSVRIINTANGDVFPLINRETLIGRHKDCDIVLNYDTVSRQHAVIICGKDGWYIKNLSKVTVIRINSAPAEKKQFISSGDIISVGEANLLFKNIGPAKISNNGGTGNGSKKKKK